MIFGRGHVKEYTGAQWQRMNDSQNNLQWKPRIGWLLADKSQTEEKRNSKYYKQVILPYLQTL